MKPTTESIQAAFDLAAQLEVNAEYLPISELSDHGVMDQLRSLQASFNDADFDALECELRLRAAVLGWTGDPLKQPPRSVLASARAVKLAPGGAR